MGVYAGSRIVVMAVSTKGKGLLWETELARAPRARIAYMSDGFLHEGRLHFCFSWEGARSAKLASFDRGATGGDPSPVFSRKPLENSRKSAMKASGGDVLLGESWDPYLKHSAVHDIHTGQLRWRWAPVLEKAVIAGQRLFCVSSATEIAAYRPDRHPPEIEKPSVSDGSMINVAKPEFQVTLRENADCRIKPRIKLPDGVVWNNIQLQSIRTTIDGKVVPHQFDVRKSSLKFRREGTEFEHGSEHTYDVEVTDRVGNTNRFGASFIVDTEGPKVVAARPDPKYYTTTVPRIVATITDEPAGVDPESIRIELDGKLNGDRGTFDPSTGNYLRERGSGAPVREGEVDAVLVVRDRIGNERLYPWKIEVSLGYDRLVGNLTRLARPPGYDLKECLDFIDEVEVNDQRKSDAMRRLSFSSGILVAGLSAHDQLAADHAECWYFIHKELLFTTSGINQRISHLEGDEKSEGEGQKGKLLDKVFEMVRITFASKVDSSDQVVDDLVTLITGVTPDDSKSGREEEEWKARFVKAFRKAHIENTQEAWNQLLTEAKGRGNWMDLASARDLTSRAEESLRKLAREAHADWATHMAKAREAEQRSDYATVISSLLKNTAGLATIGAISNAFLDAKVIKHLTEASKASSQYHEPVREAVRTSVFIPFRK